MRLFILICLFPLVLPAQQISTTEPSSRNFLQRNNIQLGIFAQRDASPHSIYTFKAADLIPNLRRKGLLGIAISCQPFEELPFLQLQLRFGYEPIEHTGDNLDIGSNRFGGNFTEQISYDHWQLATGFQLEVMPTYRCSPFFGAHYLLVIPDNLRYIAQRDFDPDVDVPVYTELNGGGKLSQGWEINTGLRLYIAKHWNIKLSIYYSELDTRMNWPLLVSRRFSGNKLLITETIGVMLATQYRW
jgi:hypothetical protein